MARVLALSSMVARGHVGLSAIVPVLQRLGHEVIALPTVLLSNHPGHPHAAAMTVPVDKLAQMLDALDANGWLGEVNGVLSGYLPSPGHVRFAASLVERIRERRPGAQFFCDPVLGDDPKGLYLDPEAALAVRAELLPKADAATPNRFELSWLVRRPVDDARSAIEAARLLPVPLTLATSIPAAGGHLADLVIANASAFQSLTPHVDAAPHGTGDCMAAMFAARRLEGKPPAEALAAAAAGIAAVIAESRGQDELDLVASQDVWRCATPLPFVEL